MNGKILICVGAVCILVGTVLALRTPKVSRQPAPPTTAAPSESKARSVNPTERSGDASAAPSVPTMAASQPPRQNVVPETGGPAQAVVRIKLERVLATVNGVAITLKDLIPLPKEKAGSEQMLSAEMYDFLFNRAVEREVTFQAAQAQNAELNESQKQRLAELRAQSERKDPAVFDNLHQSSENLDFEQRDLAGVAMQSVLAEKAGVSSPYVTSEQVEAYFQEHKSDYPQVSADAAQRSAESWPAADTDIRSKLTPRLQAEHDRQMAQFMAELKAKAGVVIVAQQK
jgi:hypothetical protein